MNLHGFPPSFYNLKKKWSTIFIKEYAKILECNFLLFNKLSCHHKINNNIFSLCESLRNFSL